MTLGQVRKVGLIESFFPDEAAESEVVRPKSFALTRNSALLELVLKWLEEDMKERGPRKSAKRAAAANAQARNGVYKN